MCFREEISLKFKFFNDEWEEFIEHCGFSDNELEVISFLRRGWAGADISAELSISERTLARRKDNIIKKITRYISKSPF